MAGVRPSRLVHLRERRVVSDIRTHAPFRIPGHTVSFMTVAAVVLAGGASRRMGRDKALLQWGAETLAARTVRVVGGRCDPVIVVKRPDQQLDVIGAQIVDDAVAGQGPLVALGQGLQIAEALGAEWAFACAVDMPLLDERLIGELINVPSDDVDAIVPTAGGRDHYLAARYRTELWRGIATMTRNHERRLGALVESVRVRRVVPADEAWVTNVNDERDLAYLTHLP